MTTATIDRSDSVTPVNVLRLHFVQRGPLVTPPGIMALVFVITGIIAIVFWRLGSVPGSPEWVSNSMGNAAVMWALPGFFGWLGVQTVALTFPLAMTFGSTRRTFVAGTVLTHLTLAAYVTAMLLVLLLLEKLTNQWFFGLYITNVYILGSGDPLQLAVTGFLGTLLVLAVGGAMAAAWVRFGALGPTALAAGSIIALGLIVILLVPAFGSFQLWWLVAAALVMIGLSILAQYLCLLRASVR
jgi:hypothetical protein